MKKKNPGNKGIVMILAIAGLSAGFAKMAYAVTEKDKTKKSAVEKTDPVKAPVAATTQSEETSLITQLIRDGHVNQFKGFTIEKRKNRLLVDGRELKADVAAKYLQAINKETMFIRVGSLQERQAEHPNSNFLQLILPASFSSPCVDYKAKEGC